MRSFSSSVKWIGLEGGTFIEYFARRIRQKRGIVIFAVIAINKENEGGKKRLFTCVYIKNYYTYIGSIIVYNIYNILDYTDFGQLDWSKFSAHTIICYVFYTYCWNSIVDILSYIKIAFNCVFGCAHFM